MERTFQLVRAFAFSQERVPSALDIVEQLVAATGAAIMEREFQSFADRYAVPLSVTTRVGNLIVLNSGELPASFEK